MQTLGINLIFGKKKIGGKVEILSTHNFLRRKFAVSVVRLQLLAPSTFLPPTPLLLS